MTSQGMKYDETDMAESEQWDVSRDTRWKWSRGFGSTHECHRSPI